MSRLLEDVTPAPRPLLPYRQFDSDHCALVQEQAQTMQGTRVVHINATEKGGGVAELLNSQVALERGLGLDVSWLVIRPPASFFAVTKKIHDLLQGGTTELTAQEQALYREVSGRFARNITTYCKRTAADALIIHDPQPALAAAHSTAPVPKALRMHVDLCQPSTAGTQWLCEIAPSFTHTIISRQDCILACLPRDTTSCIAPAIDPLAVKNQPLPWAEARAILSRHGLAAERPLITQVSRFDPWKDQLGVLAAFQQARQRVPALQLALVGFFQADDDPTAREYYARVAAAASEDPSVHLFFDLVQLQSVDNNTFIRAVQTASDIVLQKSVREGFGLTVTEAMWKGKAVIGSRAGGIRLQIQDGENGLLADSPADVAQAIVRLLEDPALRERLGKAAQRSVAESFLLPRFLAENLAVYTKLLA